MLFPRASGVLLHPTSLPGKHAIGDLGHGAYRFADFLAAAGQSLWQVLPLGPVGDGGSPYASYSAFAGNTLLISPKLLIENGLLSEADLGDVSVATSPVDFVAAQKSKDAVLRNAFNTHRRMPDSEFGRNFEEFAAQNSWWLEFRPIISVRPDSIGAIRFSIGSGWRLMVLSGGSNACVRQ